MLYRDEFEAALFRAEALGFGRQLIASVSKQLTADEGLSLLKLLQEEFADAEGLRPEHVAFQCGRVSAAMVRHLKSVSGLAAVLTLGTVSKEGVPFWTLNLQDVRQSIAAGQYHVWLTTPSFEVVDFTLDVSLRVQRGLDPIQATPIAGSPDHMRPYSWHPLVAGDAAVRTLLQTP